ncbi:MAG: nitrile hydratase subunit alpha [Hyphomicrobiaceae bacterium]
MTHQDHDHGEGHDHEHQHDGKPHVHPPQKDHDASPMTPYEVLEEAVRTLLVEKGVLTNEEIAQQIDLTDSRTPSLGAKVVARAWTDPAFKQRLLDDTGKALLEMDIDIGTLAEFRTIENTDTVHNVVVCTLCSCYPKMLLGIPPAWYKSLAYRSRVVVDPRGVLQDFGVTLPKTMEVRVHDSTAEIRYLILPRRPEGTEGWTPDQLAELITRDAMIGTALPKAPQSSAAA